MKLERHELTSTTALKVVAHINERIEALRSTNEGDLDPVQTSLVRGRIRELKYMLDLLKGDQALAESDS